MYTVYTFLECFYFVSFFFLFRGCVLFHFQYKFSGTTDVNGFSTDKIISFSRAIIYTSPWIWLDFVIIKHEYALFISILFLEKMVFMSIEMLLQAKKPWRAHSQTFKHQVIMSKRCTDFWWTLKAKIYICVSVCVLFFFLFLLLISVYYIYLEQLKC